ncbi:DUF6928 family protein [Corynebacterium pacaense]|uniref:DUF6928 family protein n=1 Tax=Corynebacterium pacaense TaxID=1816684 RepID=UPI0009BA51EF|nr:hypothetical protein [Corynebacterium pacaense]
MPNLLGDRAAIVTFWFVTASDPAAIIRSEPRADRGFGRKLLAQLNPTWPITPIGQFALNRSAPASVDEFYIAGFPGVTVIQTVLEDATSLSGLDTRLMHSMPATDTFIFAVNESTTLGGFVHLTGDGVKRSFIAKQERIFEDIGVPGGFEAPYWAGSMGKRISALSLPFNPIDLVEAAQRAWLGFDAAESPDINVVAYAIDGRPEPRIAQTRQLSPAELTHSAAGKLGFRESGEYDDYEEHGAQGTNLEDAFTGRLGAQAKRAARSARRWGRSLITASRSFTSNVAERIRHTDR